MRKIETGPGRSLAGRNVLVTGHSGFTGGWACRWLSRLGANVSGISLPPDSSPSLFETLGVPNFVDSHFVDICDQENVGRIFKKVEPEFVIHLAAQPLVSRSYYDPVETFRSNLLGSVVILDECMKQDSVSGIVCVTTDKVYENREWIWSYREGDRLGGKDPYSASKACCEHAIYSYRESLAKFCKRSIRIDSARGGNIIGGGDWAADRIVPDFVRALSDDTTLEIRCPGATRPWQHVMSLVSGYLHLADLSFPGGGTCSQGEAWNFGPNEGSRSVRELVECLNENWDSPEIKYGDAAFSEAGLLSVDIQKAKSLLGWDPVLTFEQTVAFTAKWYKAFNEDREKIAEFTDSQIDEFLLLYGEMAPTAAAK